MANVETSRCGQSRQAITCRARTEHGDAVPLLVTKKSIPGYIARLYNRALVVVLPS